MDFNEQGIILLYHCNVGSKQNLIQNEDKCCSSSLRLGVQIWSGIYMVELRVVCKSRLN